jgi:hypothetical protein
MEDICSKGDMRNENWRDQIEKIRDIMIRKGGK